MPWYDEFMPNKHRNINAKEHWQNVYKKKSASEVSWFQQSPEFSLEFIRSSQIGHDEAIIDVGGGASVLVDCLDRDGFTNLTVLDVSANALAMAKKRLGVAAANINWIESDIAALNAPHHYALWHDRAVFHFLTEPVDRKRYVENLYKALKPGGHLVLATFAIGGPQKCNGLDVVQYNAPRLMAELGQDFKLIKETNDVHITPAGNEQKYTYFHFIKVPVDEAA